MRLAMLALVLVLGCKGGTKEKANQAKQAVTKTAKNAASGATSTVKLGKPVDFPAAMKAMCDAVPDDGKKHGKPDVDERVRQALLAHPNPEVMKLWDANKDLDSTTRYRNLLMEVGRANLESCHLIELLGLD
jgi:hypothetical protein